MIGATCTECGERVVFHFEDGEAAPIEQRCDCGQLWILAIHKADEVNNE